jgi:hypothetical protein
MSLTRRSPDHGLGLEVGHVNNGWLIGSCLGTMVAYHRDCTDSRAVPESAESEGFVLNTDYFHCISLARGPNIRRRVR